jgi:uncharacterized protein YceK
MSIKKLILIIAILTTGCGALVNLANEENGSNNPEYQKFVSKYGDKNGFMSVPELTNVDSSGIVIVAAENCPRIGARRAETLAQELSKKGIKFVRTNSTQFNVSSPDSLDFKKMEALMNAGTPIVFVKGKGKYNPTLDEVINEYKTSGN